MCETLNTILSDILKVEGIEEAFSCFLVHRPKNEEEKIAIWQQELNNAFRNITPEQLDMAIRQYLSVILGCSYSQMHLLMDLLENTVKSGSLPARKLCETIISCDLLQYNNSCFWIECFKLIKRIIDMVEYKGVREIMKVSYICKYSDMFLKYIIFRVVVKKLKHYLGV